MYKLGRLKLPAKRGYTKMIIMRERERERERQINGLKDEIVKLCKETKWFADLDILILNEAHGAGQFKRM